MPTQLPARMYTSTHHTSFSSWISLAGLAVVLWFLGETLNWNISQRGIAIGALFVLWFPLLTFLAAIRHGTATATHNFWQWLKRRFKFSVVGKTGSDRLLDAVHEVLFGQKVDRARRQRNATLPWVLLVGDNSTTREQWLADALPTATVVALQPDGHIERSTPQALNRAAQLRAWAAVDVVVLEMALIPSTDADTKWHDEWNAFVRALAIRDVALRSVIVMVAAQSAATNAANSFVTTVRRCLDEFAAPPDVDVVIVESSNAVPAFAEFLAVESANLFSAPPQSELAPTASRAESPFVRDWNAAPTHSPSQKLVGEWPRVAPLLRRYRVLRMRSTDTDAALRHQLVRVPAAFTAYTAQVAQRVEGLSRPIAHQEKRAPRTRSLSFLDGPTAPSLPASDGRDHPVPCAKRMLDFAARSAAPTASVRTRHPWLVVHSHRIKRAAAALIAVTAAVLALTASHAHLTRTAARIAAVEAAHHRLLLATATDITAERTARESALTTEQTAREAAIMAERNARENAIVTERTVSRAELDAARAELQADLARIEDFTNRLASEVVTNSIGMPLRRIRAGTFTMGDPEQGDNPPHQVTLTKDFYIGVYPVTNAQYRQFKRDHNSGEFNGHSLNGDDQPVVNVSWEEAVAFCEWLSRKEGRTYRLPTEAEWEYCCRAGRSTEQSKYPWGPNWPPTGKAGNYRDATAARVLRLESPIDGYDDGYVFTSPVGRFDANPWGLYDMGGNVWEWCLDAYDAEFCKRDATDPLQQSGSSRVLRGASWNDLYPYYLRAAYRGNLDPSSRRFDDSGFRLVVC